MAFLEMRKHEGAAWEPGEVVSKGKNKSDRCGVMYCNGTRVGRAWAEFRDGKMGACYLCERCAKMWCQTNGLDYETGLPLKGDLDGRHQRSKAESGPSGAGD